MRDLIPLSLNKVSRVAKFHPIWVGKGNTRLSLKSMRKLLEKRGQDHFWGLYWMEESTEVHICQVATGVRMVPGLDF